MTLAIVDTMEYGQVMAVFLKASELLLTGK